jgi:5-(carboxyamino)imidazole ribonucleotide synthase
MNKPLVPGRATVGIIGGGQLGRMLAVAASRLGLKTHIFASEEDPPAGHVADRVTTGSYTDENALTAFAKAVDVATFEFENIPAETLVILGKHCEVRPGERALSTSQDRLVEKEFLNGLGIGVAPFAPVGSQDELEKALQRLGVPSILKTRRFGYDGKGQIRLRDSKAASAAWTEIGGVPCVLEGFVDFEREISVIAARSPQGEIVCFEPGENVHRNGILHTTTVPARISPELRRQAVEIAGRIVTALDYIGVLGVEFFVTPGGLLVNEIAPRVHNSGHWTQNGCVIDQFEQHIRAIAGWPLGDGSRHADVMMRNLIGEEVLDPVLLHGDARTALHIYGKKEPKPGRKMGHINRLGRSADSKSA